MSYEDEDFNKKMEEYLKESEKEIEKLLKKNLEQQKQQPAELNQFEKNNQQLYEQQKLKEEENIRQIKEEQKKLLEKAMKEVKQDYNQNADTYFQDLKNKIDMEKQLNAIKDEEERNLKRQELNKKLDTTGDSWQQAVIIQQQQIIERREQERIESNYKELAKILELNDEQSKKMIKSIQKIEEQEKNNKEPYLLSEKILEELKKQEIQLNNRFRKQMYEHCKGNDIKEKQKQQDIEDLNEKEKLNPFEEQIKKMLKHNENSKTLEDLIDREMKEKNQKEVEELFKKGNKEEQKKVLEALRNAGYKEEAEKLQPPKIGLKLK